MPRFRHRLMPPIEADGIRRFHYISGTVASPGFEPRVLELRDGTKVHVRPIVPEDEQLLIDALAHRLAVVDYNDRFALVGTTRKHDGKGRIVGVARYDRAVDTDVAETAV